VAGLGEMCGSPSSIMFESILTHYASIGAEDLGVIF
jgi:hypothetical protein